MPKWIKELHDAEWLRDAYQTKTVKEIGALLHCAPSGVSQALKRHGIQARQAGRPAAPAVLSDREWLASKYAERTSREIAAEIGCHQCTVVEAIKVFGIPIISGGRRVRKSFYRQCVDENGNNMPQHRYIMEQHLGRKLGEDEHVHHLDEDKMNNALKNLIVLSKADHHKLHAFYGYARTCKACGEDFKGANSAHFCRECKGSSGNKLVYAAKQYARTCKKCAAEFLGHNASRFCPSCKGG